MPGMSEGGGGAVFAWSRVGDVAGHLHSNSKATRSISTSNLGVSHGRTLQEVRRI